MSTERDKLEVFIERDAQSIGFTAGPLVLWHDAELELFSGMLETRLVALVADQDQQAVPPRESLIAVRGLRVRRDGSRRHAGHARLGRPLRDSGRAEPELSGLQTTSGF